MSLSTYLTFEDNCREVFEFYRSVFGGEFTFISTFRDGPEGLEVPEAELDRIMHVSLPIGSSVLMGNDSSSSFSPPLVAGTTSQSRSKRRAESMRTRFSPNCQTAAR